MAVFQVLDLLQQRRDAFTVGATAHGIRSAIRSGHIKLFLKVCDLGINVSAGAGLRHVNALLFTTEQFALGKLWFLRLDALDVCGVAPFLLQLVGLSHLPLVFQRSSFLFLNCADSCFVKFCTGSALRSSLRLTLIQELLQVVERIFAVLGGHAG